MADEVVGPEGGSTGSDAFKVLGRIEVDLDSLRKSLSAAEGEVRKSAAEHKRIWGDSAQKKDIAKTIFNEGFMPGDAPGAGGEGAGGGGSEGGGHSATANFAHLARVVRHTLIPALSQISPELGRFISVGAQSARTAVFFGGAIGGVAIGAAILSEVIGRYVATAKEATATTVDVGQALEKLDFSRAQAGMNKSSESLAKYVLQAKQSAGEVKATFVERLLAGFAVLEDRITGKLGREVAEFNAYAEAAGKIAKRIDIPEAAAKYEKEHAELAGRMAALNIRRAATEDDLTTAYRAQTQSIKDVAEKERELINFREKRAMAPFQKQYEDLMGALEEKRRQGGPHSLEDFDMESRRLSKNLEAATRKDREEANRARQLSREKEAEALDKDRYAEMAARARNLASIEEYTQKDIERSQKRLEGRTRTAEAIAASEAHIAQAMREHRGESEGISALESRLEADRQRARAPLLKELDTETRLYESRKRGLEALIAAGEQPLENTRKLVDLEAAAADKIGDIHERLAQADAARSSSRHDRLIAEYRQQVALEERGLAHRIAMGRATIQEEIGALGAATTDPRRSTEQRESAEQRLLEVRKSYAAAYFQYYKDLGAQVLQEQLSYAVGSLSQMETGSRVWLDQVHQIAGLYKDIHDQAQGIFNAELGIAEQEARRLGRKTMGIGDVSDLVASARKRDAAALGGARVPVGELSAAVGRRDVYREMDRTGLTPGVAWQRAQQDPQAQLAEMLGGDAARRGPETADRERDAVVEATAKLKELSSAADLAAASLRGMASTASSSPSESAPDTSGAAERANQAERYQRDSDEWAGSPKNAEPKDVDTVLGRNMVLGARRWPSTTATFQ